MRKNNDSIVYFELNNWFRGEHYPDDQPFIDWMGNDLHLSFNNEDWVTENKLCVVRTIIDMSVNFCVTATRNWVEKNCPKLLIDYTRFLRFPDKYGDAYGKFGDEFLEYEEDNIGIKYVYDED